MARERRQIAPALLASLAIHAGLGALALFAWPHEPKPLAIAGVPVTIVSDGPPELRKTVEGPEELDALTEEPIPLPPEPVAPPAPEPTPQPLPPKAKPAEKPKPPTPSPAPSKRAELDFDDLESRLAKRGGGQPNSGGKKGPERPPTSPTPQPKGNLGGGPRGVALEGLQAQVQRRWRPNCFAEGARGVRITVEFRLSPLGQLIGDPKVTTTTGPAHLIGPERDRVIAAIRQAVPFRDVPDGLAGQRITMNFNVVNACI
jgi:protein TonB